jgi:hypothetical protein
VTRLWGIDGALTGAAVRLADDGVTALEWHEWRRSPVVRLPIEEGDIIALEQAYLGKSVRSFRSLVEWRERFKAGLPPVVLAEPNASHWRAKVLRVAGLARKPAKERAIAAATLHAKGLPAEVGPDLAEAWCLARWCWGWNRVGRP